MSKTFALFSRMSPYMAEKARNLVDAMLLSTEEIGWDSQQQLIANKRVYHDTDIVRLIAYVMSPAKTISKKPIGLNIFISALKKIGLESDYVINQDVKKMLRKNNQSNDDNSEDEKEFETSDHEDSNFEDDNDEDGEEIEYETSDHDESNFEDDNDEDGEEMDDYDDTNDDDYDSCYKDDDGNSNTEDDEDDDDNDSNVNTDSEEEEEEGNSNSFQDKEPVSNDMLREYDWKSISDSDNESVTSAYKCISCKFDCSSMAELDQHIVDVHLPRCKREETFYY